MGNNVQRKKSKKNPQAPPAPPSVEPPAGSVLSAAQKMKMTISKLEKRKTFVEKRIEHETELAKKNAKNNNKTAALLHIKKKKVYEKDVSKLEGMILNLEQQSLAIESSSVTYDAVEAMKTGLAAQKKIIKEIDVEKTDDLMADIKEMQDEANEVSDLLAEPVEDLEADDELLKELQEMELEVKQESQVKTQPVATEVKQPEVKLPQVPSHEVQVENKPLSEDEAALAQLMAEMQ